MTRSVSRIPVVSLDVKVKSGRWRVERGDTPASMPPVVKGKIESPDRDRDVRQ